MCASSASLSAGDKLSTLECAHCYNGCPAADFLSTAGGILLKTLGLSCLLETPVAPNLPCTLICLTFNVTINNCICPHKCGQLHEIRDYTLQNTWLGFQFFKKYANICSYNIKLFLFVKGFCCLHKIESPTFIHKLNQQLQVFFVYLPIQIKTTFLFYCVYIPATCCILWVSHRPLRFKHRKDHTTQRESNVNEWL